MNRRVLIVDDEPDIRELLCMTLTRMEIGSDSAASLEEGRRLLGHSQFDLCLTDMRLPDGNGIDLVRHIQKQYPQTPVAVITAYGSAESAVEALKAGAFDFVSKPIRLDDLRNLVNTALKLSTQYPAQDRRSRMVLLGDSPVMRKIRSTIVKLARSQAPVYISGESGTGKEMVARLIHAKGPRAEQPFVPVNCGAIPSELMESEFFGHKKGSFTGAHSDKPGLFQAAEGGTLFLDEIAELPQPMQVKLLRAIQEKAIRSVGAAVESATDVRILSATHKDLRALTEQGQFRQDLYYRINVINLQVPSLRQRIEDIPMLATHLMQKIATAWGVQAPSLEPGVLAKLSDYDFPGNVRELENILERAMTLCDGGQITGADLSLSDEPGSTDRPGRASDESLDSYLQRLERQAISEALQGAGFNKTQAAKQLGITFRALRYKLDKLGIDDPSG